MNDLPPEPTPSEGETFAQQPTLQGEARVPEFLLKVQRRDRSIPSLIPQAHAIITSCPPEVGGWVDDGESFVVLDIGRFSAEIIPRAYKHNKWSSFVRQLHNYGFRKIFSEIPDAHAYQHRHFTRSNPQLGSMQKALNNYTVGK